MNRGRTGGQAFFQLLLFAMMVYKHGSSTTTHSLGFVVFINYGLFFNIPKLQETIPAEFKLGIAKRRHDLNALIQRCETLDNRCFNPDAVIPLQRVVGQFYLAVKHLRDAVDGTIRDGISMAVDVEREQAAWCLVVDRHVIQFQGKVGIIDYPAIEGGFGAYLNLVSLIGDHLC